MVKKNSMESVTTTISMIIDQMNARRNLILKVNAIIARNKDANLQNAKPSSGT